MKTFEWKCRDRKLVLGGGPLIMGILNVTPDSFSDGGRFLDSEKAVGQGLRMAAEGAAIIDVGGESTRPGAEEVSSEEELARVIPVIRRLAAETGLAISVDTTKAVVAREALKAGAHIINDVSALSHDAHMPQVAQEYGAGVVLMHMQGTPRTMQNNPEYSDVVRDVTSYLTGRADRLINAGLERATLAIDPGIGFGKTLEHNLQLLAGTGALVRTGYPVVIGLSRKSFLGRLTGCEVGERLAPGLSALAFCVLNGAHVMRVHDVKESVHAAKVAWALASHV